MRSTKASTSSSNKSPRCPNPMTICFTLLMGFIVVYLWNHQETNIEILMASSGSDVEDNLQNVVMQPSETRTPLDPQAKAPSEGDHRVGEHGIFKGKEFKKGHIFDPKLSQALTQFFKSDGDSTSILELGAGRGDYAKMFKSEGLFVSCYDGNPDTQYVSDGRCAIIDLSKPIDFFKHDWVLSLEVGEHVPKEFEKVLISNMDKGSKKGIIISWAVEGQPGLAHVNNRNNDYIREQFNKLEYTSDFEVERVLRDAATLGWFKNTLMVFRKKV